MIDAVDLVCVHYHEAGRSRTRSYVHFSHRRMGNIIADGYIDMYSIPKSKCAIGRLPRGAERIGIEIPSAGQYPYVYVAQCFIDALRIGSDAR